MELYKGLVTGDARLLHDRQRGGGGVDFSPLPKHESTAAADGSEVVAPEGAVAGAPTRAAAPKAEIVSLPT